MRFVKPLKGFRFWKTIGMLFFSAAILTGSALSSGNKACALEEPVLPPTMMLAAAPQTPETAKTSASEQTSKAKITKKEAKAPVVKQEPQEPKVSVEKSQKSAAAKVSKAASNKVEIVKTPEPLEDSEELALPKMPAEVVKSSVVVDDDFEVAPEKPVEASKAKVEIVEPVKEITDEQSAKPVVKAEEMPISNAEIKLAAAEKHEEAKPVVKAEEKPVKKLESKPVAKAEVKPVLKAETKPAPAKVKSVEAKPAAKAKKAAKKAAVDESVIPQEWDWFSTPLVWVEDANGKMVLMADKSASRIEIGNAKTVEPLPVFEDSKAVRIAEELPLITSVKPAEPDYIEVVPMVAEEDAEADNTITLEEAPAIPEDVIVANDSEPEQAPVVPVDAIVADDSEPEQAQVETVNTAAEEKTEYRPFAAAAERMARIRRLREAEAEARGETIAKADRSERAERINRFISELLNKSKDSENKIEETPKTEIVPMAPPANETKAEKKAVKSMEKAQIEAENSKNDTRLAKAENNENMTFEPYVGIFGSSASRRIDSAKWKSAWVR